MDYIPRLVDKQIDDALATFGAVLIEGPKWCGKTTTAQRAARSSIMLSDPAGNFSARQLADVDPAAAIEGDRPRLIDEWQEVPKLWDAVRYECDREGKAGLYILTGSATPRDANAPMHSGVGRVAHVAMGTLTLAELGISSGEISLAGLLMGEGQTHALGRLSGVSDIAEIVVRGGWPGAVGGTTTQAVLMAREYVRGVCDSDASRIDGVRRDPDKVMALVRSLARNESTLASTKAILSDMEGAGISRQTAAVYLSVLSHLHFIQDIPAWSPVLRSPVPMRSARKHHMADPSLAAAAIGAGVEMLSADTKTLGFLFESLAIHDLLVYAQACGAKVSHYHDAADLEVDAVVSSADGSWIPIEIKLGTGGIDAARSSLVRIERKMTSAGERPPAAKVVLVGFGTPAYVADDGVRVIPVDVLGA